MAKVILYDDKNDDIEITVQCTQGECLAWGGLGLCDLCGNECDEIYLCPELGSKGLCQGCFKEHKKMVQWYVEDTNAVFNTLIIFVQRYNLNLSENDLELINEFFRSKGHMSLDIRRFM